MTYETYLQCREWLMQTANAIYPTDFYIAPASEQEGLTAWLDDLQSLTKVVQSSIQLTKEWERKDQMNNFGTVDYKGQTYQLQEAATPSNCVFTGWFGDAQEGESYTDQWQARAVGADGYAYLVTWEWQMVKGQEPEDGGDYPWSDDNIVRVEMI